MALSDDQRAMLRLLAQREEGYDDIAALMGLSVGEVRAKVKETLATLDDSDVPAPKSGDTPQQAPAEISTPEPPAQPAAPEKPQAPPKAPVAAKAPKPATSPSPSAGTPRSGKRPPTGSRPQLKLPADRGARLAIMAGVTVVVLLVVLIATGAFGGEDSDSGDASAANGSGRVANASIDTKRVTGAVLEPADGGDATGRAVLGRDGKEPLLQVEAEGLDPSPQGESYTVWLYSSPKLALRVGSVRVGDSGGLAAQFPLPIEVLQYIAAGAFKQIDLSLTSDTAYNAEVSAAKQQKRLPRYIGTTVLRGQIVGPLAKFAKNQDG